VSSLFLFPTLYASAIIITLPIILFLYGQAHRLRSKVFLAGIFLLLSINLIFTTGRFAMLGWMLGAVYFYVHSIRYRSILFTLVLLSIAILGVALFVGLLLTESTVQEKGKNILLEVVNARGSGSPTNRWIIYQHTLSGFWQRPLVGWGTERDFGNFPFPAGSHSYYLGTLYKQGIVGLLVFLARYSPSAQPPFRYGTLFNLWSLDFRRRDD
jgi:O-antigen ligase